MADVSDFELYHGIALTKLVRNDEPVTLRLIETDPRKAWAAYILNDEVAMYAKYRTSPYALKRVEGGRVWNFQFGSDELTKIQKLKDRRSVYLTLICGRREIKGSDVSMHTCLVRPDEVSDLIEISSPDSQNIKVKYLPGKYFRVSGSKTDRDEVKIPRSRLGKWQVPGS